MERASVRVVVLALLLTGCAYQPRLEITTGARSVNREYLGMANCLELSQQFARHVSVGYQHCSDIRYGKPFNEKFDLSHDVVGVTVGWGGNPR
jgi:hypothetical protein